MDPISLPNQCMQPPRKQPRAADAEALGVYHHSVVCFVGKMPRTELPYVRTASTKADS